MKGKIKQKRGNLTDDDLTAINGQRDLLRVKFRSATASPRIKSKGTYTNPPIG